MNSGPIENNMIRDCWGTNTFFMKLTFKRIGNV